jgi:hypothetical protein
MVIKRFKCERLVCKARGLVVNYASNLFFYEFQRTFGCSRRTIILFYGIFFGTKPMVWVEFIRASCFK